MIDNETLLRNENTFLRERHAQMSEETITLRNENIRLRAALEPFAAEFDEWGRFSDDFYITDEPNQDCNKAQFTMADLKKANDLVNKEGEFAR